MASQGDQYSVTLPIQSKSLAFAHQVSSPCGSWEIEQRVFQNAIAVATVQSFFEILGITSSYEHSDLGNPAVQIAADVSDLCVSQAGKLECRWIYPEDELISVPVEGWGDRIGYVFISADLSALEATIHGFTPSVDTEQIRRSSLQSVEFMLQHLDAIIKHQTPGVSCLTRWLSGTFEAAWQDVESLFPPTQLMECAFRGAAVAPVDHNPELDLAHGGTARRAKIVTWQCHTDDDEPEPIVLVVEINQGFPLQARIRVQIHPMSPSLYLPAQIRLSILDASGQMIAHATSRSIDNYLQLPFKGKPGESFQVKLGLRNCQIVENFQI